MIIVGCFFVWTDTADRDRADSTDRRIVAEEDTNKGVVEVQAIFALEPISRYSILLTILSITIILIRGLRTLLVTAS